MQRHEEGATKKGPTNWIREEREVSKAQTSVQKHITDLDVISKLQRADETNTEGEALTAGARDTALRSWRQPFY